MNLQNFQSFLDTVTLRRPMHGPFQKLRILNTIAIHQQAGNLPFEGRLIENLEMHPKPFNRLLIELINEGLVETLPCSWADHRFLLVLTDQGSTRVDNLIRQFHPASHTHMREPELMSA